MISAQPSGFLQVAECIGLRKGKGFMPENTTGQTTAGLIGAVWGVTGFSLILLDAINRLARIALHALEQPLNLLHWLAFVVAVAALAWFEGYRGFQKKFSPRCAARIYYLYRHPEPVAVWLAPLFCMGFFRATRAPLLFAWVGTSLIVLLVVILHSAAQPWRGIIDAGVVVGLSWGLVSFWISVAQTFRSGRYPVSPEVPGSVAVAP
jgi:hypothetical protein